MFTFLFYSYKFYKEVQVVNLGKTILVNEDNMTLYSKVAKVYKKDKIKKVDWLTNLLNYRCLEVTKRY